MLDLKTLRADPEAVRRALIARGDYEPGSTFAEAFAKAAGAGVAAVSGAASGPEPGPARGTAARRFLVGAPTHCVVEKLDRFAVLDARRKQAIQDEEGLKAEQNKINRSIAETRKAGADASGPIAEMKILSDRVKALGAVRDAADAEIQALLLEIPNVPDPGVPIGADSSDNPVIATVGAVPTFGFKARDHVEIGGLLGGLDFERASKVAQSRFVFLQGPLARLSRALIMFMLDLHTSVHGYEELLPPFLINRASLVGTGQLPKFESDLFAIKDFDLFLAPTAEVPVTNLYRDEILREQDLPKRFAAYTPCFRSEAGSWGKDTRGMIRQHQFDKVELVKFTRPEDSEAEHLGLLRDAKEVLNRLGLPYREVVLCTGDLGFSAARCHDIEVWLPSQETYREISSCSNFRDFQARRANIRWRPKAGGKPEFVHTINGSGLAVGRTLVAILENFQREDGSVEIPEALRGYLGGTSEFRPVARASESESKAGAAK